MAVKRIDDIDGSTDDVQTVKFTFGGVQFTIDLSEQNQQKLTRALEPYIQAANKATRRGRRPKPSTPVAADTPELPAE